LQPFPASRPVPGLWWADARADIVRRESPNCLCRKKICTRKTCYICAIPQTCLPGEWGIY